MMSCIPGEKEPYPPSPPNTITQNYSFVLPLHTYPPWEVSLKATSYALAMFMAIFGNLFVMMTVVFNRGLHGSTNLYILNLAFSDLMVGSLNMWMHLISSISSEWPFNATICKAFPFLQIMSLTASVLFMAVIAGERFLAIVFPLKARLSKPYQHAIVIFVVWSLASIVGVPNILVRQRNVLVWSNYTQIWCDERWPRHASKNQPSNLTCLYEYPERQLYYNLQVVVMYFVPVVVMTIAYGFIIYVINIRKVPGEQTARTIELQQKTTKKVVTMLLVVFVVFVICWTPQEVIVIMDANWPSYSISHVSNDMRYIFIFVAYFNSSLNPLIYSALNEKFRQGFRELWRTFTTCKRNKVHPGDDFSIPVAARTNNGLVVTSSVAVAASGCEKKPQSGKNITCAECVENRPKPKETMENVGNM